MPAELFGEKYEFLPKNQILSFEEITRLTRISVEIGATKVRITGGEPLLRRDLVELISQLASISGLQDLTLTTNGHLLADLAAELKEAGLRRLTVSLDSLDEEVFKTMNGREYTPDRVLKAIQEAEKVGFHPIKINTVVQKDVNDHTLVDLVRYFRGTGHILRFIEFMDVGTRNGWDLNQVVPAEEILSRINETFPLESLTANYPGEVARRYRLLDGSAEIGVITSVTQPFCNECTRARISTDGKLYTCLFAHEGEDLRALLRGGADDREIKDRITHVWQSREDRYSEIRSDQTPEIKPLNRVEMYQIGG